MSGTEGGEGAPQRTLNTLNTVPHPVRPNYRSDGGQWFCYTCKQAIKVAVVECCPTCGQATQTEWVHKR